MDKYKTIQHNVKNWSYAEKIMNLEGKIQALEKENEELKQYIENKSDIIKAYDEYKNSNLRKIIASDEKLSQEFDDVFNSCKICRDRESNLLVKNLEKAKNHFEFCSDFNNSYDEICWMQDDGKLKYHCENLRQRARSAWQELKTLKELEEA